MAPFRSGSSLPPPPLPPTTAPVPIAPKSAAPKPTEIVTIPERFYGVAVKMEPPFDIDDTQKPVVPVAPVLPPPPPPPPMVNPPPVAAHRSRLWMGLLVVVILLFAGGGWIYWNRATLFGKEVAPVVIVQPPTPPNTPINIEGRSPSPGTVSLSWFDQSSTEAGFRIERRTNGNFSVVQTLPANSQVFLDSSAEAGVTSSYRVVAFNEGGDSAPSAEVTVEVMALAPAAPPAPTLPPDGLDSDSDGLTDVEELAYGTNPRLPDSDSDGYLDGNEVFNLYSPIERAPKSLLKSPLAQTVSSTIGWQLLAPAAWHVAPDATDANVMQLTAPSNELLVVRVEANPASSTLIAWYLSAHPTANPDQLITFTSNKYGLIGLLSPDRLTGYFAWKDKIISLSYQLNGQPFVNLRISFGLILNSVRLTGSPMVPDLSRPQAIPPAFSRDAATSTASETIMTTSTVPMATTVSSTQTVSSSLQQTP